MIVAFWNDLDDLYHHAKFGEDQTTHAGCRCENMVCVCHSAGLPARCSFKANPLWTTFVSVFLCWRKWSDWSFAHLWIMVVTAATCIPLAASESRIVWHSGKPVPECHSYWLIQVVFGEPMPEMSPFWILLELRMMEVVSGDSCSYKMWKAPVKSSPSTNQHPVYLRADLG